MHRFTVRKGELWCESVPVARIAQTVGTPFYLYSQGTLLDHYRKLKRAFRSLHPLICFSVKANGNLAVLSTLVRAGAGLDIVSGGELYKATQVGCPPKRIVFASVGKSPQEIRQALQSGILCFNVESAPELAAIQREARHLKVRASVALRVNPDVAANTHHYITTGSAQNKFGIALSDAEALVLDARRLDALDLLGFHIHIGSQITQSGPYVRSIQRVRTLILRLRRQGVQISTLNLGGGLGIVYKDERPMAADTFARAVLPSLKKLRIRLILEPGRFIAGNSGVLVTRVLYVKETPTKRFAIVDAGMNDFLRPSLYGAHHDIVLAASQKGSPRRHPLRYDVVGPVCESGDFFAENRLLPQLTDHDLLAIMGTGAYGFTMASNYNARPRPPEVMVQGRRWSVVRRRETYRDLIRGERIPKRVRE